MIDQLFQYDPFDNPQQHALDACNPHDATLAHAKPPTAFGYSNHHQETLCIMPKGLTHNQEPICNKTYLHLQKLTENETDKKFLHIGFAGLFNFDIVAAGGHDAVLLLDINTDHNHIMKDIVRMLAISETPADFVSLMAKNEKELHIRTDEPIEVALYGMPWLRDKQSFNFLHNLASDGKIYVAYCDIYDSEQVQRIKQWVDESGYTTATIYASNILEHALQNNQNQTTAPGIAEALNLLPREQQDFFLYGNNSSRTSYQDNLPADFTDRFYANIDTLSSKETLSFITSELPLPTVSAPRIVVEGKIAANPIQHPPARSIS